MPADEMYAPEGEVFPIRFRVIGNENPAEIAYYHVEVDVFLHQYADTGEWVLMTDQAWLDAHEEPEYDAPVNADYARFHIDGTPVDPADPFEAVRVDPPESEQD